MGDNNDFLYKATIQYEAEGTADVLADADKIQARVDDLASGATIDLDLNLSNDSVLLDLEALDSAKYTPLIDLIISGDSVLSDLDALDSATYTPDIKPDFDDTPLTDLDALNSETYSPDVKPELDEEGDEVLDRLDQIRNLQVIELTLSVVGTGLDVISKAYELLTANQEAVALLEARTAESIPNAGRIIDNVLIGSLADSREEIAQTLALADQLEVLPDQLESAASGAFDFAAVWDEDVNEVLRTANQLVNTGLAEDFPAAFDLLQTGFESGLNKGGDLLDVLNEYGTTFADMKLNGEQTLNALNSGLEAGFDNADRVADALREFNIRASNPDETAAQDALKSLGLGDEAAAFQAGELTGGEFFRGVISALQGEDTATQQTLAANIFGAQAEDFGLETLFAIDPVNTFFDTIEGRAGDAADEFDNTLGQTMNTFWETIQVKAGEFLSSDQLGLADKLEELRQGLEGTIDALVSGKDLGEAIEIGFKVQGVQEALDRFQSIAGNLAIGFLEVVAKIQEFTGGDSSGTRAEIARLAGNQLAFDLKVANPDEVGSVIKTALDRGVDTSRLADLAGTSVTELLNEGDIGKAQALLDGLRQAGGAILEVTDPLTRRLLEDQGMDTTIPIPVFPDMSEADYRAFVEAKAEELRDQGIPVDVTFTEIDQEQLSGLAAQVEDVAADARQQFDEAFAAGDLSAAAALAESLGDADLSQQVAGFAQMYRDAFNEAMAAGDYETASEAAAFLPDDADIQATVQESADKLKQAYREALASGDTDAAVDIASLLGDEDMQARLDELLNMTKGTETGVSESAKAMASSIEDADSRIGDALTGNTVTASFEAVSESAATHFPLAGEAALGLVSPLAQVDAAASVNLVHVAALIVQADDAAQTHLPNAAIAVNILADSLWGLGNVLPILVSTAENLRNVQQAAQAATANVQGALNAGQGVSGKRAGGGSVQRGRSYKVGEEGEEIFTPIADGAILNNRTTEAILGVAQSLFAGLQTARAGNVVNTTTTNRPVYLNIQQNVQSQAEAMSAAQQTANALRGY